MSALDRKAALDAAHAAVRGAMTILEDFHSDDRSVDTAYRQLAEAETTLLNLSAAVPAFAVASGEQVAA